ncbi:MAG: thiamine-phosphate kinase [Candidatus Thorarchaeota archaeon]
MSNNEQVFLSKIIPNLNQKSNLLPGNEDAIAFRSDMSFGSIYTVNVDSISWSSDALPSVNFSPENFGRKCVVVTLSDLCAKGVEPKFFLSAVCVPSDYKKQDLEAIISGMNDACEEFSVEYLGGDLGTSLEVVISGVAIGQSDSLMMRKTCKIDDSVYVTGFFGYTGLAYAESFDQISLPSTLQRTVHQRILRPYPKIVESSILKEYASACIDSSDGLAISLYHLSNESNKIISLTSLPIDPYLKETVEEIGHVNLLEIICHAGEEFELVFTISRENEEKMLKQFKMKNLKLPIRIGTVISEGKQVRNDTTLSSEVLENRGWDTLRDIV